MNHRPRAVVAGWFSYRQGHATAGDLLARDVLCDWLDGLAINHVTPVAPPFTGGPMLEEIDGGDFTHAFFVCGPFGRGPLEADFLTRFAGCRLVGVNLSLNFDPDDWQPFDFVIERDSTRTSNPDLAFASRNALPPVIGICLREPDGVTDVAAADDALHRLLQRHAAATVPIDTRLDANQTALRSKGEIEAVIARMDAVVTTRLHGLVLALKNGVPALVVDSVPGGGKVSRQCASIGWPNLLRLDELDDSRLDEALKLTLGREARELAAECAARAVSGVRALGRQLTEQLVPDSELERRFSQRQSEAGMRAFQSSIAPLATPRWHGWRRRIKSILRKLNA